MTDIIVYGLRTMGVPFKYRHAIAYCVIDNHEQFEPGSVRCGPAAVTAPLRHAGPRPAPRQRAAWRVGAMGLTMPP
jgi:hypothetical protein